MVIDRSPSLGEMGPLHQDVRSALYGLTPSPKVSGYVLGLGGKDISQDDIANVLRHALSGDRSYAGTYGQVWPQVEVSSK